jgi:hypothetical protein
MCEGSPETAPIQGTAPSAIWPAGADELLTRITARLFGRESRSHDPVRPSLTMMSVRVARCGEKISWGAVMVTAATMVLLAGCGGGPPAPPPATPAPSPRHDARDLLAASVATAKDRRYVATYKLRSKDRPDRTVTVALAADNTWVVSVPGGLLGGYADAAVFRSGEGLFQCSLGPAGGVVASDPAAPRVTPGCAKVKKLTAGTDPKVQHIFTDWIDVLLDPAAPFSVAVAQKLANATGTCFSIESNSAALASPVDPGIYCYGADGTLTAARTSFGTLTLVGAPDPAPASIALPAPIVADGPLSVAAPPPPPSPTTSVSAAPTP